MGGSKSRKPRIPSSACPTTTTRTECRTKALYIRGDATYNSQVFLSLISRSRATDAARRGRVRSRSAPGCVSSDPGVPDAMMAGRQDPSRSRLVPLGGLPGGRLSLAWLLGWSCRETRWGCRETWVAASVLEGLRGLLRIPSPGRAGHRPGVWLHLRCPATPGLPNRLRAAEPASPSIGQWVQAERSG